MSAQATPAAPAAKRAAFCGCTVNHLTNALLLWQVAMIIIYGTSTKFAGVYDAAHAAGTTDSGSQGDFLWVSLAVTVGLGYFFTVASKYSWSTVGFTLLIAALTLQWAQLVVGFWDSASITYHDANAAQWPKIELGFGSLLRAEYILATILIALGAVAGRVSALQAAGIAFWGTIFAAAIARIGIEVQVVDAGGSMAIHIFGAAFGLAASAALNFMANPAKVVGPAEPRNRGDGTLALISTALLFVVFPVFNNGMATFALMANNPAADALAVSAAQGRSYYNTVAALASSVAGAFLASKSSNGGSKFRFEHAQRAAIAGAAGIAAAAPILNNPWGAMLLGLVVGTVSVIGFKHWTPALARCGLYDGAGVLNTSLVPGIIGCVASAIAAARVTHSMGYNPESVGALIYDGRTVEKQGGYQMGFGLVCLLFGLITGALVGFVNRLAIYEPKNQETAYDDAEEWDGIEGTEAAAPVAASATAAPKDVEVVVSAPAPAPAAAPAAAAGEDKATQ